MEDSSDALSTHSLPNNPGEYLTRSRRQSLSYGACGAHHEEHHSHAPHIPHTHNFLPLQPELILGRSNYGHEFMLSGMQPAELDEERWQRLVRSKSRVGSVAPDPRMRTDRLIGNMGGNDWDKHRPDDILWKGKGAAVREYYEKMNRLIDCYAYIDKLLDSNLPHQLLNTYHASPALSRRNSNETFEEAHSPTTKLLLPKGPAAPGSTSSSGPRRHKRRPSYLYRIADEESPLMGGREEATAESRDKVVRIAIYLNLACNAILLLAKLIVTIMTSSLSVVASLVDGVMDMLSSVIIFITSKLVSRKNHLSYPVGRARLEPLGVLVFSVIMITSFVQVLQEGVVRLFGSDRKVVELGPWAIAIMVATVIVKGGCWLWCRMVQNSSVQALAADALTDVVFNTFSILFPLAGHIFSIWWLDPLGGILLSIFVIIQWSRISAAHIRNLTGGAASPELISIMLYLTMRFARAIKRITAVHAYHAGDRVNVEVDIILDETLGLRDAHDLGESLQSVIESLPVVERAFVHLDYDELNPAGHLR